MPRSDLMGHEAHHQRQRQARLLSCRIDPLGDRVALHDAAEDVDQEALHVLVGQQDLERIGDLLLVSATPHIEEVRGAAALELDHVHGRHREASTVDHAADVAIERDVGEIMLGSLDLFRIFFVEIAELPYVGVLEDGVAVKGDFSIECAEVSILVSDERVDLNEHGILFPEHLVNAREDTSELFDLFSLKAECEGDLPALVTAKSHSGGDRHSNQLLGSLVGDLLDVHAAFS